jgi:hypothetical protein
MAEPWHMEPIFFMIAKLLTATGDAWATQPPFSLMAAHLHS